MFSAVDAVLIRPLPYADADRLVMIWYNLTKSDRSKSSPAPAEWLEWRRLNTVFTDIAATEPGRFFEISDRRSQSPAAIVNETFANRNFPGRSARESSLGTLTKKTIGIPSSVS